jgi:lysosomal acid lipase/cholesteryl ester hydrolase
MWDYSLQEMGEYDVKANVEFICNLTGHQKVNYMGHSQGTAQMFARACLYPKWC